MGFFRNENAHGCPFRDIQQQGKCSSLIEMLTLVGIPPVGTIV